MSPELAQEAKTIHWVAQSPDHLTASNSTLILPPGMKVLLGNQAQTYQRVASGFRDDDLEAIVGDHKTHSVVFLEYDDAGYVTSDDWKNVDAAAMLKSIQKNTEDGNSERRAQGISAILNVSWLQEPVYDPRTNEVHWALQATSSDSSNPFVNSIALVLGRHGYERYTWVAPLTLYQRKANVLADVVAGVRFDKGSRYADFVSGDKLAGYGIAALVGTAAGATIAKTVGFGGLLLLIKKLWFLIIAGILAGWRWIKARFDNIRNGT